MPASEQDGAGSGPAITTEAELDAIYGDPVPAAVTKELDHVSADYARFIAASPFVVLGTAGPGGLDCSPRGDGPGFVRVHDERTLLLPDRRGNNRVDSLRNLVHDPRVALLFLIPGDGRTLRVNGTASLSRGDGLRESFAIADKVPACVIVVSVEQCYFQCPKALVRSHLWDPERHVEQGVLPSTGELLERLVQGFDGPIYDREYPAHMRRTLY